MHNTQRFWDGQQWTAQVQPLLAGPVKVEGDASSAKLLLGVAIAIVGSALAFGGAIFLDYTKAPDYCHQWSADYVLTEDLHYYGNFSDWDCERWLP